MCDESKYYCANFAGLIDTNSKLARLVMPKIVTYYLNSLRLLHFNPPRRLSMNN